MQPCTECQPFGPCGPVPLPINPPPLSPALANAAALRIVLTNLLLSGFWNSTTAYPPSALVIDGNSLWISLQPVPPNYAPALYPAYWYQVLAALIPGPAGPMGNSGDTFKSPVNGSFIPGDLAYVFVPFTLNGIAILPLQAGSLTISVYRNGNPITGLQNISVTAGSPPANLYAATGNNVFNVGDYLQYVISNCSTPTVPSGLAIARSMTPTN